MQTFDFKIAGRRARSFSEEEPRLARHHTWVAVAIGGSAVLGAGVSMVGANKQAKANQAAQDQNAQLQREQNNSAWASYLMQRGLNPAGATAGVIPENAAAINTKLPLWATYTFPSAAAASTPRKLVRRGAAAASTPGAVTAPSSASPMNSMSWWRGAAQNPSLAVAV